MLPLGLSPGNSREFTGKFISRSKNFFGIFGNFVFTLEGHIPQFHDFFRYFSFGLDQALLSKKTISKLKIIVIRKKKCIFYQKWDIIDFLYSNF